MRSLELGACDGVTFRARDGVTSRDGVTLGPRDGVTLDVIGGLASELPVWELVLGIKNLAPAQDVLNLPSGARSTVKVQPSHINRVSEASERLMANSPYGEKATKKSEAVSRGAKTAEKPPLSSFIIRRGSRVTV